MTICGSYILNIDASITSENRIQLSLCCLQPQHATPGANPVCIKGSFVGSIFVMSHRSQYMGRTRFNTWVMQLYIFWVVYSLVRVKCLSGINVRLSEPLSSSYVFFLISTDSLCFWHLIFYTFAAFIFLLVQQSQESRVFTKFLLHYDLVCLFK